MNIQNISEEKAREYAAKSMRHEEWLFSSLDDAFAPKYGTVIDKDCSWYYTRLYKEEIQTKGKLGTDPFHERIFRHLSVLIQRSAYGDLLRRLQRLLAGTPALSYDRMC